MGRGLSKEARYAGKTCMSGYRLSSAWVNLGQPFCMFDVVVRKSSQMKEVALV